MGMIIMMNGDPESEHANKCMISMKICKQIYLYRDSTSLH